jgi:hypothetical protein
MQAFHGGVGQWPPVSVTGTSSTHHIADGFNESL